MFYTINELKLNILESEYTWKLASNISLYSVWNDDKFSFVVVNSHSLGYSNLSQIPHLHIL